LFLRTLDEKARNIYKENVDLNESLRIYQQELDALQKSKEQLTKQATSILSDKEMNDHLIKEKIEQVQKQNKSIKEVKPMKPIITQFILF
jgi:seryl-tRNA synthetase